VSGERNVLWAVWAAMFASLALYVWLPTVVPPRAIPWRADQTAVATFVVAIFAIAAAVGTFAIRESLALRQMRSGQLDPTTPEGHARIRVALLVMWALCDAIAILGLVLAIASSRPQLVVPYAVAAAVFFVLHHPNARYFERPRAVA
jgi:hypothetical protein